VFAAYICADFYEMKLFDIMGGSDSRAGRRRRACVSGSFRACMFEYFGKYCWFMLLEEIIIGLCVRKSTIDHNMTHKTDFRFGSVMRKSGHRRWRLYGNFGSFYNNTNSLGNQFEMIFVQY
jgi:hypothetical protein